MYFLFFNNSNWIELNGTKYSPNSILDGINNKSNNKFKDYMPILNFSFVKEMAKNLKLKESEILEILNLFSFCNKITELESNDFYGLLLKLQEKPSFENFKLLFGCLDYIRELPSKWYIPVKEYDLLELSSAIEIIVFNRECEILSVNS